MPPQPKRKRGRPAATTTVASPTDQDASQTAQRPRKRAKPSPQQPESSRNPRGAKRTSRSSGAGGAVNDTTTKAGPANRRRRSSLNEAQTEKAQNQETQKTGGGKRKRRSRAAPGEEEEAQEEAEPRKRGPKPRGRPSLLPKDKGPSSAATVEEVSGEQPPPRRRRRSSGAAADSEDVVPPPSPPKPYPHVAKRIRRIRRSHISSKWAPLTGPSLAAVNTLLTLAHRPILQRLSQTSQRRQHTAAALRLITNRINRRLARGIPFPPSAVAGKETELDFEGVLDGKAVLERQLDPAVHAVELLRREKKRVEAELERDYETLRNLEAGARGQARQQRELLKKAHVLAPSALKRDDAYAREDVAFKREETDAKEPLFANLQDEELKDLALQLGGHVESMRLNLNQAEGIIPEMAKSRAALQAVLMQRLDRDQYEKVVLG